MFWVGFIAASVFWVALIEWRTGILDDFLNRKK